MKTFDNIFHIITILVLSIAFAVIASNIAVLIFGAITFTIKAFLAICFTCLAVPFVATLLSKIESK